MKTNLKKYAVALTILFMTGFFTACNNEENTEELSVAKLTLEEVSLNDEADAISEEVTSVVEDIYTVDEMAATAKGYLSDFLPDCVTITTLVTDISKEKTIDFGDGCELRNGNVLSGIIKMSYLKDMEAASKSVNVSFENFFFNEVGIAGSKSILRVLSNENGNPQSDVATDITATWPDGATAMMTGNKTREWIEGHGTGFWGDNVFLITGNWGFVNRDGLAYAKEVLTPLRREWACRFIVNGVVQITRGDAVASLDFGDGGCDAFGTLTHPDGSTEEIRLRRFKG